MSIPKNVNLSPLHILLVDDKKDWIELLRDYFISFEAQVTICDSGLAAFDLIAQKRFNLLILDISMPEVTGWDMIKAIRAHPDPRVHKLPVLALTAKYVAPEDKDELLRVGYDNYFRKGPDQMSLLSCLETYAAQMKEGSGKESK